MTVLLTSAGDEEFDRPASISINVKPHLLVVLALCVSGSLLQALLSGLVRMGTAHSPGSVFKKIGVAFVGQSGHLIFAALAKGFGATVIALILEYAKIIHFGSVDTSSKLGYLCLGFLVGFWSLRKLYSTLKDLSHGTHADEAVSGAGSAAKKEGSSP